MASSADGLNYNKQKNKIKEKTNYCNPPPLIPITPPLSHPSSKRWGDATPLPQTRAHNHQVIFAWTQKKQGVGGGRRCPNKLEIHRRRDEPRAHNPNQKLASLNVIMVLNQIQAEREREREKAAQEYVRQRPSTLANRGLSTDGQTQKWNKQDTTSYFFFTQSSHRNTMSI